MKYRQALGKTTFIAALVAIPASAFILNQQAEYNAAAPFAFAFFGFYAISAYVLRSKGIGGGLVSLLLTSILFASELDAERRPLECLRVWIGSVIFGAVMGWILEGIMKWQPPKPPVD